MQNEKVTKNFLTLSLSIFPKKHSKSKESKCEIAPPGAQIDVRCMRIKI